MLQKVRKNAKAHIFVVDDDKCILEAACVLLKDANYECTCFSSPIECVESLNSRVAELLITDVKMPGMDGLQLLAETKRRCPWLPVIVMTSYADIPMAVQAVKAGAFEFIEKPFEVEVFLETVGLALKENELDDFLVGRPLTKTEKVILRLILEGMSNKGIAYRLQRSERTVEVHRSHIMRKLDVDNVVDLVKRATSMGFGQTR